MTLENREDRIDYRFDRQLLMSVRHTPRRPIAAEAALPLKEILVMDSSAFRRAQTTEVWELPPATSADCVSPWSTSCLRRVLDFCVAAIAVLICAPVLLIAGAAIFCTSSGPILFRQRRMGRLGKEFTVYKFRSMYAANRSGSPVTVRGDARITPVGAFLRRFKLDELPQLWNVLKGDMSLVGPRPRLPHHEGLHLLVRPGLTGAATLAFRDEEELLAAFPPDDLGRVYEEFVKPAKARLDYDYMRRATFTSDLAILWKTVISCLS